MTRNLLMMLFVCMVGLYGYGQQIMVSDNTFTPRLGTKLTEEEIARRIMRVGYERRLGIDSVTAMRLVQVDIEKENGIRALLEDSTLSVAQRATGMKSLRTNHDRVTRKILPTERQDQLYASSVQRKPTKTLRVYDDTLSREQSAVLVYYEKEIATLKADMGLDAVEKSNRIAELEKARNKALDDLHLEHIRDLQERQNRIFERSATKPVAPERPVPLTTQDQEK